MLKKKNVGSLLAFTLHERSKPVFKTSEKRRLHLVRCKQAPRSTSARLTTFFASLCQTARTYLRTPTMISMGAFVASGGMDTLRYHAIAVHIGDVLMDEADDQTFFVDFRFRFISEQARTFFIKQFFGRSAIEQGADSVRCVYPTPIYPTPRKLVSLMSNEPRPERSAATRRTVPLKHLEKQRSAKKEEDPGVMDSSRREEVRKSVAERKVGSLDRERESVTLEKAAFLPDTMWIDRKEALSKILRPADTTEPVISSATDEADTFIRQRRHTAGPSYQSDSNSDSSYQTSCDMSDDEFTFVSPRHVRASSLIETQDSAGLTTDY